MWGWLSIWNEVEERSGWIVTMQVNERPFWPNLLASKTIVVLSLDNVHSPRGEVMLRMGRSHWGHFNDVEVGI